MIYRHFCATGGYMRRFPHMVSGKLQGMVKSYFVKLRTFINFAANN